jgi:hypothetical protein
MFKIFSNFRSAENDDIFNLLREKWNDKPITLFYDYIPQSIEQLQINPYNFIWLAEPDEFFGMHTWVLNNYNLFTGILTWNELLLNNCPNAVCFPFHADGGGIGEVTDEYLENFIKQKEIDRKFEVSFLSGAKSLVEGHRLRQEIYKIGDQITIPKKWFYTLDDFDKENFAKGGVGRPDKIWNSKQICFKESMFHIGVENVNYNNWYTEKIADSFATKTIPIYWGCSNLGELGYDERGIIRFNTIPELISICNSLTPDMYDKMKPYVDHNYNEVKKNRTKNIVETFFKEIIELNNL